MYNWILYLFGYNDDYYKEPEVIITPSLDIMEKKVKEILDNHRRNDYKIKNNINSKYQFVIDELKEKLIIRTNKKKYDLVVNELKQKFRIK